MNKKKDKQGNMRKELCTTRKVNRIKLNEKGKQEWQE